MTHYRFLFDHGEVTIKADSLAEATGMLGEAQGFHSGFLRNVECHAVPGRPEHEKKTFEIDLDDAKYLVSWDSEPSSGDGWNEPRSEAHAWIDDLYMWQTYNSTPTRPNPGGRWVRIHEEMLHPSTKEYIEDECNSHAFPERD